MKEILEDFKKGKIGLEEAENLIKSNNILEIDNIAKIDTKRQVRTGFPEAILAETKDYDDLLSIITGYYKDSKIDSTLLITRLSSDRYDQLKGDISFLNEDYNLFYNKKARILIISNKNTEDIKPKFKSKVGIITAGTSDIPVAEEAKVILEESGVDVLSSYDIGVAGIHRLFPQIAHMMEENVKILIICAGMEGALPSVIAGLVDIPIIAVPTSIGYGVGFGGRTALDSMLQSCAPGISVVNIDNGFGAAVNVITILQTFEN
ncbi:nickel pincer cofactor biosynthesis protein LarB [Methanobrevibacter sp. AbM4]|uniref:nickel pincer cofactor biosynthesis protein LarB n=1 Tax=Methanobrevibacter sp. AbM4 TaxID=224719 RepID=UPI0003348965|nr:nickel pincer cofactor biosynthesis protein LarB [Methanobrevibacter sp. AbM4]AGN17477.1 phosphoribosylaminoimidazole carboxylase-related protein [Methanobrevibacter sp. AbM4]